MAGSCRSAFGHHGAKADVRSASDDRSQVDLKRARTETTRWLQPAGPSAEPRHHRTHTPARSSRRDLAVFQVLADLLERPLVRVAETAAARRKDAEQVALGQRKIGDGRTKLPLAGHPGVDDVGAERAWLAAAEAGRGEALARTASCEFTPGARIRISRRTASPPRCRPAPPESGIISYRSRRSGNSFSITSIGRLEVFVICRCVTSAPSAMTYLAEARHAASILHRERHLGRLDYHDADLDRRRCRCRYRFRAPRSWPSERQQVSTDAQPYSDAEKQDDALDHFASSAEHR